MGSSDFNPNVVAAFVAIHELNSLKEVVVRIIQHVRDHVDKRVEGQLAQYLNWAISELTCAKVFLTPDRKRQISDVYVPVPLRGPTRSISDPSAANFCTEHRTRALILGRAGSGKSTLLQHMISTSISDMLRIPVLIPLRSIDVPMDTQKLKAEFFFRCIHSALRQGGADLTANDVHSLLDDGIFLILLDGLDEVPPSAHAQLSKAIDDLLRYHQNEFIVTSRPGADFRSWPRWEEYATEGITLESAKKLIGHAEYGEDLTKLKSFHEQLDAGLYQSHVEFASNPLLLSLMYMTFYACGDVPSQHYEFYSEAFHVLWNKHDTGKPGMSRRDRRSGITGLIDFRSILEAFAIRAQLDGKFEFSTSVLHDYLSNASEDTGLEFEETDFARDVREGMSLFIEDGLETRFVHRSFQEFFAAGYLINASPELRREVGPGLIQRSQSDQVLSFISERNPGQFERDIIMPQLEQFRDRYVRKDSAGYERHLLDALQAIRVTEYGFVMDIDQHVSRFIASIELHLKTHGSADYSEFPERGLPSVEERQALELLVRRQRDRADMQNRINVEKFVKAVVGDRQYDLALRIVDPALSYTWFEHALRTIEKFEALCATRVRRESSLGVDDAVLPWM